MITKTANYYLYKEAGLGNFIINGFNTAKNWVVPRFNNMRQTANTWWHNPYGGQQGNLLGNTQKFTFGQGMQNFAGNAWGAIRNSTRPMQQTFNNWWYNNPVARTQAGAQVNRLATAPSVANQSQQMMQGSLLS